VQAARKMRFDVSGFATLSLVTLSSQVTGNGAG
jgi:hypothetical protein